MSDKHTAQSADPSKDTGPAGGSVASDIRTAATEKYDETVKEVRARADGAKSDAADEVTNVATALRHAAEEMRGGSAQERTLSQIASSLADASDAIRDKDLGEITQSVSRIARDNPVLFLGGAALLGFAASRYAKASGEHQASSASRSQPGNSMTPASQIKEYVDEGNPNTQPIGGDL